MFNLSGCYFHDLIMVLGFNGMYVRLASRRFVWLRGEENSIFVAYYEQIRFGSGLYQAMEPVSNGPVLKDLLAKGGRDIVRILSLPEQSTYVRIREKIDRN